MLALTLPWREKVGCNPNYEQGIMINWRDDYEAMRSTMVFGPSLTFDALIERLHLLEERFRQ